MSDRVPQSYQGGDGGSSGQYKSVCTGHQTRNTPPHPINESFDRVPQSYQGGDGGSSGQYKSVCTGHRTRKSCNTPPHPINESSDRVPQSYQGGDGGSSGQYKSVCTGHQTRKSRNTPPINQSSNRSGRKVIETDIKQAHLVSRVVVESNFSRSAKRFKEVEVTTAELVKETILEKEQHSYHCPSSSFGEKQAQCPKLKNSMMLPNIPSCPSSSFGGKQAQCSKLKNSMMLPNIPSTSKKTCRLFGREITEWEDLHNKMPQSVHDVEAIFSQTTHSLLITKNTDGSLCKEKQIFREPRVSTQPTGNTQGERYRLSPLFDTDTMGMDSFTRKSDLCGADASPLKKVIIADPSASLQPKTTSAEGKVKYMKRITELPDINMALPAKNITDPSTSKAQNLDVELLLSLNPPNPEPKQSQSGSLPDPESIWIKRLKSNSAALGTKSSTLGERLANALLGKTTKGGSTTNTELTLAICGPQKGEEITLSHPWIQRLRHKQDVAPQKKRKADDCWPHLSPSVVAMAVVGRTIRKFQPCKFQQRGALLVWNTEGF